MKVGELIDELRRVNPEFEVYTDRGHTIDNVDVLDGSFFDHPGGGEVCVLDVDD
jgi:hypothetical protein